MPRNGSGTFTITNSFSSGTTISSSQTNANNADIGAEITGSLPRDGQAGMTAQLPLSNGTVSVPALAFTSDTDSGWYRIGANEIGLSLGGSKVVDFSATGVAVTGTFAASGVTSLGDGTVGTPGLNFVSDTDSGLYRLGANNIGVGVNGAKVLDIGTTGLGITGTLTTTSTIELGNASDTTIARVSGGVISVEGSNVLMASNIAAQSDMETATSTATWVSPGRQYFHPSHPKASVNFNGVGTAAINRSSGVSSLTDNATSDFSLNWTTAFSDAFCCFSGTCQRNSATALSGSPAFATSTYVLATTTTRFLINFPQATAYEDPLGCFVVVNGDL